MSSVEIEERQTLRLLAPFLLTRCTGARRKHKFMNPLQAILDVVRADIIDGGDQDVVG